MFASVTRPLASVGFAQMYLSQKFCYSLCMAKISGSMKCSAIATSSSLHFSDQHAHIFIETVLPLQNLAVLLILFLPPVNIAGK